MKNTTTVVAVLGLLLASVAYAEFLPGGKATPKTVVAPEVKAVPLQQPTPPAQLTAKVANLEQVCMSWTKEREKKCRVKRNTILQQPQPTGVNLMIGPFRLTDVGNNGVTYGFECKADGSLDQGDRLMPYEYVGMPQQTKLKNVQPSTYRYCVAAKRGGKSCALRVPGIDLANTFHPGCVRGVVQVPVDQNVTPQVIEDFRKSIENNYTRNQSTCFKVVVDAQRAKQGPGEVCALEVQDVPKVVPPPVPDQAKQVPPSGFTPKQTPPPAPTKAKQTPPTCPDPTQKVRDELSGESQIGTNTNGFDKVITMCAENAIPFQNFVRSRLPNTPGFRPKQ
jgi:hypothetical protein